MNTAAPHIVILCSRLDLPGGIERAVTQTANLFAANKYRITLLVLDVTTTCFYPLVDGVHRKMARLHFGITENGNTLTKKVSFTKHIFRLRRVLKQLRPDMIISTEYPFTIAAKLAVAGLQVPVIGWEHHHFHHLKKSFFWKALHKTVYPSLAAVVCLNPTEADFYTAMRCKTAVIPNGVAQKATATLQAKNLLTVGWLSPLKGVMLIPEIAKQVFSLHPDWRWTIIGSGAERLSLLKKISEYGLMEKVIVVEPTTPRLDEQYQASSMYVMLSAMECFPMVLLEAASNGVPSIAFDCPTGPRFIINHNKDGYLIPPGDVSTMANAITHLIGNEEKRKAFGTAAFDNVKRFSEENILLLWQQLFDRLSAKQK